MSGRYFRTYLHSLSLVLKEASVSSVGAVPLATKKYCNSSMDFLEISNSELNDDVLSEAGGYKGVIVVNDGTVLKEEFIANSKVPVLLKGVSTRLDALSCMKLNIQGIVVCNNGTMPTVSAVQNVLFFLNFCALSMVR